MYTKNYKASNRMRTAQKFVLPLYMKGLNNKYTFSSTCTLIRFKTVFFIVFAAHAIQKGSKLEDAVIFYDGTNPTRLVDISSGHRIYDEYDLVIVNCLNNKIMHRHYFNIESEYRNLGCLMGPIKHGIICHWIGFPNAWSKFHKITSAIKQDEQEKNKSLILNNREPLTNTSCKFFIINSDIQEYTEESITGVYIRKNAELKIKGKVDIAIKPSGMSGGPIFTYSNPKRDNNPENCFLLLGIGLRYDDKKTNAFSGVSNIRLIKILDEFLKSYGFTFNIVDSTKQ